jgi:hypothetical protein
MRNLGRIKGVQVELRMSGQSSVIAFYPHIALAVVNVGRGNRVVVSTVVIKQDPQKASANGRVCCEPYRTGNTEYRSHDPIYLLLFVRAPSQL